MDTGFTTIHKEKSTVRNLLSVSLKFGMIIGALLLVITVLSFIILVFPEQTSFILGLFFVFSLLFGYWIARTKKENLLSAQKEQNEISLETLLSNRELEVFKLLLTSKSNREISIELFIEVSTLKSHINRIYKKVNVSSRVELRKKFSA